MEGGRQLGRYVRLSPSQNTGVHEAVLVTGLGCGRLSPSQNTGVHEALPVTEHGGA